MRFLCDTNIISEVMKRSPNPDVKQWLNQQEGICLSVITVEEVYSGLVYKNAEKQRKWFEKFLRCRFRYYMQYQQKYADRLIKTPVIVHREGSTQDIDNELTVMSTT